MRIWRHITIALIGVFSLEHSSVSSAQEISQLLRDEFKRPTVITFPDNAPYSPQVATLGKMLFFDPRLSGTQNMSCTTCHNPSFGWETPVEKAIGTKNVALDRHAPTVLNLYEAPQFFWDGRAKTLEEQAEGPITHPKEMGANFPDLIARLEQIEEYQYWFGMIFPEAGITKSNILTAIATFERTLISGWSAFDDWIAGDENAISNSAKRGFDIFTGKAGCSNCHSGWNFTDHQLHDIGLETEDLGGGIYAPDDQSRQHTFKTPTLRNITDRAPFMHHGDLLTLRDVIAHYETGGIQRPSRSKLIKDVKFTNQEVEDLISFMATLTEPNPNIKAPSLPPR